MIRLTDTGGGTPLYRLKITLRRCKPPIWRRIVVRADMKLDRLHRVIQTTMGWLDCHLHQFVVVVGKNAIASPGQGKSLDSGLRNGFCPQVDTRGIINTDGPLLHFLTFALGTDLDQKRPNNRHIVSDCSISFEWPRSWQIPPEENEEPQPQDHRAHLTICNPGRYCFG